MTPLEKSTRSCNMFWSPPPTTPFTKPQLHVIVPFYQNFEKFDLVFAYVALQDPNAITTCSLAIMAIIYI